jgi:hypothetical protein
MGGGMGDTGGPGGTGNMMLPSWYGPGASTGGAPNTTNWPDWAKSEWGKLSVADQGKWQSAVAGQGTTPGGGTVTTPPSPVANLGFPSPDLTANPASKFAAPVTAPAAATGEGFTHTPYPLPQIGGLPHVGGEATPEVTATTPTTPEAPKESPMDWLYPGNLPMDFDSRQGEFGKPRPYSATGPFETAGYGAAGNFGGVAGYGPQQEGLKPKVLLPDMKAGTKLEGADIDQRNRVRREDYDRYMKLYGVGYDLPAYQQALNGLVYQQNMQNYTPGGGG